MSRSYGPHVVRRCDDVQWCLESAVTNLCIFSPAFLLSCLTIIMVFNWCLLHLWSLHMPCCLSVHLSTLRCPVAYQLCSSLWGSCSSFFWGRWTPQQVSSFSARLMYERRGRETLRSGPALFRIRPYILLGSLESVWFWCSVTWKSYLHAKYNPGVPRHNLLLWQIYCSVKCMVNDVFQIIHSEFLTPERVYPLYAIYHVFSWNFTTGQIKGYSILCSIQFLMLSIFLSISFLLEQRSGTWLPSQIWLFWWWYMVSRQFWADDAIKTSRKSRFWTF